MKRIISLNLALIFFLSTLSGAFAQTKSTTKKSVSVSNCENGECIQALVDKLQDLSGLYRSQCLPKSIKESEIMAYHEKNGFTETCWKYITEINHLEEKLLSHQSRLEAKLGCESGECKTPKSPADNITAQLTQISQIENKNSCGPKEKAAIAKQCPADMNCALMSSAMLGGAYLAELIVPKNWKPAGCNLNDDSCITQLVTGFLKAAFTFFEGAWDLIKYVGKKAGDALNNFWGWVTGAEDHSSTSQLALAKASEDKGVFDMLVSDFSGTMKKIWQALVASLKEWLKTDIFCQKWSGTPHLSTCQKPTESFDCLPCKTMVNGLCAITGTLVAEVIPAFFTGGLLTAAKHGINGAAKIAKVFKVSKSSVNAIKKSKLGKSVAQAGNKVDDVLHLSKGVKAAKAGVNAALSVIKKYVLSPTRKLLKASMSSLSTLSKKSTAYISVTGSKKVLTFSGKALKSTAKVIIYPIENPLTIAAFKAGQRSFDKVFKLGSPKLVVTTGVAAKIINKQPQLESSLAKLEAARISPKPQAAAVAKLEQETYEQLVQHRKDILRDFIAKEDDLDDVIKYLYPELEYSTLAKSVGREKVLEAERELWSQISKMPDGATKESLLVKYNQRINENALRSQVVMVEKPIIKGQTPSEFDAYIKSTDFKNAYAKKQLKEYFREEINLKVTINELYDELNYGEKAIAAGSIRVKKAEKELLNGINKLTDGPYKTQLLIEYEKQITKNPIRNLFLKRAEAAKSLKFKTENELFNKAVIENSLIVDSERFEKVLKTIGRRPKNAQEAEEMFKAIEKAHQLGSNSVYEYSWKELRRKYDILISGHFTPDEANEIIRLGLVGRPPVRELIKPGKTLFSGFAEDIIEADYLKRRELFIKLVKKHHPESASKIIDNVESLYFIDYQHAFPDLDNILTGSKTLNKTPLTETYEQLAFDNFKETRKYLLKTQPEVNKETLLQVHKRMLKGGVEDAMDHDLGIIRDGHWAGNVPDSNPITLAIKNEVTQNPYLTWIENGEVSPGHFSGKIMYPNSIDVKKEALDLIRHKNKKLVSQIEEYQSLKNNYLARFKEESQIRFNELEKLTYTMTNDLVDALVDNLMDWFTRERTLIGEITSPEKLDEYVNLLAKFQRDLVSIHPLANGNGRSTRELLNYALMKEGFPPARIIDTNADIYNSLDDWKRIIKHGILSSDFLMDDMIERLKFGLPIDNSLDLVTPYSRPPMKMALKGEKKIPHMEGVEYIDPRLYRELVKRMTDADPALKLQLSENPLEAWDKIHRRADEIFANNNVYYKHPKKGIERIEIGYVDDDFKLLFGKSSFHNQELFDFKMKTWYSNDINWRGLASTHSAKSEKEIVSMFKNLDSHMASNSVLGKTRNNSSPEAIRKAALEDFNKLNDDIFSDGLVKMARDHSETGPMYGISYGYSTSKNREVGKAFSMGAMVVGKYGEHKLPELQALLKSRVLVGARKSVKDVDLGRLKQVRPDFSYKYGRQQEVMGIGASDPDAITIIQTIDAQGDVILSYLRNPKKANEIWVIKGDIDPHGVPTKDQLMKSILLND